MSLTIEQVAADNGIVLGKRYSSKETAERLGISEPVLSRLRTSGQIGYRRVHAREVEHFGLDLVNYLMATRQCPDTESPTKKSTHSASGTLTSAPAPLPGTAVATSPTADKSSELAYAQRISQKRKGRSRTGTSPSTDPAKLTIVT
jgi:hypothetical protein